MNAPLRSEVIVVGAGPVGLVAAQALARLGLSVTVVERARLQPGWQAGGDDARVYAISPASAGLLDGLGLWAPILATRAAAYRAMRVWERDPAQALAFDAGDAARAELGWIVEHALIVDVAAREPGAIRIVDAARIVALESGDGLPPVLQLEDGRRLEARLLIAADGADSSLRRLAGIEVDTQRYPQDAVIAVAQPGTPHHGTAWQRFLGSGPLAALPLADGRVAIVWSALAPRAAALMAMDDAAFAAELSASFQQQLGAFGAIGPRTRVALRRSHAEQYFRDGVVLVGDAAHAVHPLAGQGVNLGFADVAALVEAIAAAREARRDWAGERTLAAYARVRRAANAEMIALTDALARGFSVAVPGLRAALGLGLEAVGRVAPLRSLLVRGAIGA